MYFTLGLQVFSEGFRSHNTTHVNSLSAKDEQSKVEQEDLHNSSSQEDAPAPRSNAGSMVNSALHVDAEEPSLRLAVSPESSSADLQKLEPSDVVSMVQSVDRHAAESKLEYHVELAELQCPAGSILLNDSMEGMVAIAHKVDITCNADLAFPLNAVKVGVEHLGTPARNNQALLGSSYQSVDVDHHGGDQGSCSSLGMLMRNIDELRKQIGASRARVLKVSYNHGQSLHNGSGSVRSCSELPGMPVISDCLLQIDNSASARISKEHLVDDVGISGSRGVGTITPSPLPVDGMSPSSECGGSTSFLKKPKRCKKKYSPSSLPHV
ncbi:hypothetical protein Nepgr_031197 [Nepenthes gracilis]|uniref:Uncharacterized protein n=1 Tax=Nepenthes gracilis TaxID=150966 RepID=A0AAD3Y6U1_NEPGR|nr:hypothetical protein Nepgr_031197 [Nepenthes gracilis]